MTHLSDEPPPEGPGDKTADVLEYLLAALLGVGAGLVGSFIQLTHVGWLPVGVLGALVLLAASLLGAGYVTGSRLGTGVSCLGWFATVVLLAWPRVEGDVVLPATGSTNAWIFGGTLLGIAMIAFPHRRLCGRRRFPPR